MAPPAFSLLVMLASYDFTAVAFFASVYTILISTIVAASGSSETKKTRRVKRKITTTVSNPSSQLISSPQQRQQSTQSTTAALSTQICQGYRLPKSSLHGPSQTIAIPRTEVTI
ncbi:hypothetical protein TWF970_008481 [Orbilia oligospora]|uniref:Uncharacterized protein n=1 Tax=Orbilia oligospora TaxID=2813651 RepID=A0A7C8RMG3_ORBOL|nr:hypothetical protein TWF970_008481 [Orbilia oligospora]